MFLLMLLVGCSYLFQTKVEVVNQSGQYISDVIVDFKGERSEVATIPSGNVHVFSGYTTQEGNITLYYSKSGKKYSIPLDYVTKYVALRCRVILPSSGDPKASCEIS